MILAYSRQAEMELISGVSMISTASITCDRAASSTAQRNPSMKRLPRPLVARLVIDVITRELDGAQADADRKVDGLAA